MTEKAYWPFALLTFLSASDLAYATAVAAAAGGGGNGDDDDGDGDDDGL